MATTSVSVTVTASVGSTARAAPEADSVVVSIVEPPGQDTDGWTFTPARLVVHVGTTVVWVNTGRAPHSATADDGSRFDSSTLYPQATFRFTPQQAGTIAYHCTLHPWMKGTLVVRP
jgi:plastocyanin